MKSTEKYVLSIPLVELQYSLEDLVGHLTIVVFAFTDYNKSHSVVNHLKVRTVLNYNPKIIRISKTGKNHQNHNS